jgi:hypothetical protein
MKSSFKKVGSFAVVFALAFGSVSYSLSASAATWGEGDAYVSSNRVGHALPWNIVSGWTSDLKPGYPCVYQRLRKNGESWPGTTISGSLTCSSQRKYYSINVSKPWTAGVRMYREDGRYQTLWGPL